MVIGKGGGHVIEEILVVIAIVTGNRGGSVKSKVRLLNTILSVSMTITACLLNQVRTIPTTFLPLFYKGHFTFPSIHPCETDCAAFPLGKGVALIVLPPGISDGICAPL